MYGSDRSSVSSCHYSASTVTSVTDRQTDRTDTVWVDTLDEYIHRESDFHCRAVDRTRRWADCVYDTVSNNRKVVDWRCQSSQLTVVVPLWRTLNTCALSDNSSSAFNSRPALQSYPIIPTRHWRRHWLCGGGGGGSGEVRHVENFSPRTKLSPNAGITDFRMHKKHAI